MQNFPFSQYIAQLLLGIAIFTIGWLGSKWAHRYLYRLLLKSKTDQALARFLASLVRYMVLAATLLAALNQAGIPATSFLALLASAGLAIGLALQGSLANFAAGVMVLFFRPFTLGDRVTVAGHTGTIDDIGL